uniref:G-protein coupled receptors family 1 profile domain-containing protein n=1 Tax=Romanomermis culicivorax TaxID=13658 RepID=A0A915HM64_ROMCU
MNNSSISTSADYELSMIFLNAQIPAYMLWILAATINASTSLLSIMVLHVIKLMSQKLRMIVIVHLVCEILHNTTNITEAIFHISMALLKKAETTTAYQCFQYIGFTFCLMSFSNFIMFLVSIDRFLAIYYPSFYNTEMHYSIMIKAIIFEIFVEFCRLLLAYFDIYPAGKIPVCLHRASQGLYFGYYQLYVTVFLSVVPVLLYFSCFVNLWIGYHKARKSQNGNLVDIKKHLRDKITRALVFMTIWQLLTMNTATFFAPFTRNLPYKGSLIGPYFGTLFYVNGLAFFIANCVYVKTFRDGCMKMLGKIFLCRSMVEITTIDVQINGGRMVNNSSNFQSSHMK